MIRSILDMRNTVDLLAVKINFRLQLFLLFYFHELGQYVLIRILKMLTYYLTYILCFHFYNISKL